MHDSPLPTLIVGQGIAGTLMAFRLWQAGLPFLVIDEGYERSSTRLAAGIVNPITGRRYAKSWLIDRLLPVAEVAYRELETLLGQPFLQHRPIVRVLNSVREANDWQARMGDPDYARYHAPQPSLGNLAEHLRPPGAFVEIRGGFQVDVRGLVTAFRAWLRQNGWLREAAFAHADVQLLPEGGLRYRDLLAGRLIFCEGAKALHNPFFQNQPFEIAKGELLWVRLPGVALDKIVKKRLFIAPAGGDRYWVGATLDKRRDEVCSPEARDYLEQHLADMLATPYHVEGQAAALRPTVKDRRPLIGPHPEYPQLVLFNGMGTKGTSLAPYFSQHLFDALWKGQPLMPEVRLR